MTSPGNPALWDLSDNELRARVDDLGRMVVHNPAEALEYNDLSAEWRERTRNLIPPTEQKELPTEQKTFSHMDQSLLPIPLTEASHAEIAPVRPASPRKATKPKNWRTILGGSEFRVQRMSESPYHAGTLDNPEATVNYLNSQLSESIIFRPDVENLIVVHLSTRRKAIGFEVISTGILDTLLVHAREVFRSAIVANSSAIVLAHNHPSGDPTPSEADIKVTRDLIRGGQLLKIEVLDHVILGKSNPERSRSYSSLRELGYFYTT